MKRCSSCGTYADDNAYVCPRCGANLGAAQGYAKIVPQQAPQQQQYQQQYQQPAPVRCDKSNVAAGVLAILFGYLGVHYFYMGKVGGGFLCILLSLVTCGLWDIIVFIQGIVFLCMSNEDFNRKFVCTDSLFPIF